jgi:hypothetical protein
MAVTGDTNVSALKTAVLSSLIQDELAIKGVLQKTITNVSEYAVKGAKSIGFPKADSFTVQNRASGQMANIQNLDFALDTMPLDQRATVAWIIDAMDEAQVALDLQGVYAVRAASAHARNIDAIIVAKMDAAAQTASTGALTDAGILSARKQILTNNADRNGLQLILGPDSEATMLGTDKFVRYDALGVNNTPIVTGLLGRYYGMDTYVSNSVQPGNWYIWDKSAGAIGFQREPQTDQRPAPEYGSNSLLKVLDMLFGVQALQLGVEGAGATKSALIFKGSAS